MELEDNFEDNFFNQQCEALRSGIDTKKNFTEDMLEYDDLLMFITYEMCHGDTDLVYENWQNTSMTIMTVIVKKL